MAYLRCHLDLFSGKFGSFSCWVFKHTIRTSAGRTVSWIVTDCVKQLISLLWNKDRLNQCKKLTFKSEKIVKHKTICLFSRKEQWRVSLSPPRLRTFKSPCVKQCYLFCRFPAVATLHSTKNVVLGCALFTQPTRIDWRLLEVSSSCHVIQRRLPSQVAYFEV